MSAFDDQCPELTDRYLVDLRERLEMDQYRKWLARSFPLRESATIAPPRSPSAQTARWPSSACCSSRSPRKQTVLRHPSSSSAPRSKGSGTRRYPTKSEKIWKKVRSEQLTLAAGQFTWRNLHRTRCHRRFVKWNVRLTTSRFRNKVWSGVFCNGIDNGARRVTAVQKKVPWFPDQQAVLQDPPHQSASHLEFANLSTGLRTVQETKHSSVLSRSSALRFAQDLSEKQSIPLFHCIDGSFKRMTSDQLVSMRHPDDTNLSCRGVHRSTPLLD